MDALLLLLHIYDSDPRIKLLCTVYNMLMITVMDLRKQCMTTLQNIEGETTLVAYKLLH